MNYFFDFLTYLLQGYGISTILYLSISLFSGPLKRRRKYYLSIANTIAAVAGMLMASVLAVELIVSYYTLEDTEHLFFYYRLYPSLASIILLCGISLLTLFLKLRRHLVFTLVLIFILNTANLAEALYLLIVDYFSSDMADTVWKISKDDNTPLLYIAPLSISYFFAVYIIAGKQQAKEAII